MNNSEWDLALRVTVNSKRISQGLALVAIFTGLTGCATSVWTEPERAEVWLLIGQSNMSGRGSMSELPRAVSTTPSRILLFDNGGRLVPAREPLDSAQDQIDTVSADPRAGVGPGLAFAQARAASHPRRRLVLVPCAKGGSGIADWAAAEGRDTLFGSCMARAREASRYGRLTGVLWYQGESDARSLEDAAAWSGRTATVMTAMRSRLESESLPILLVSLADPPTIEPMAGRYPGWNRLQAAQVTFTLPGVVVVSASGLPRNEDQLHLSTAGQVTLGRRLAVQADRAIP